jgi:hypothetical protein
MHTTTHTLSKPFTLQPLRPSELANAAPGHKDWLWQGYLAPAKLTAFTSPPKSGKTTLASRLFVRMEDGGQFAGLSVAPARVLVVSEESISDWDARCRQLAIGHNVQFVCRPFQGARPTDAQWSGLIAELEALHAREPFDLLVIDALATLLPGYAETCAPKLLDCLLPIQALANQGPAVWLLHHPTKKKQGDGQAARGTGALAGFVDIVMEMRCVCRARSKDRRRRICAYSRYVETPRQLIVELTGDGTDYAVPPADAASPRLQACVDAEHVLSRAHEKLTVEGILEWWPDTSKTPDRSTLSRCLNRAMRAGQVLRTGAGHSGDPYRYWLPGREPLLFPGYDAGAEEIDAWKARCSAEIRERLLGKLGT